MFDTILLSAGYLGVAGMSMASFGKEAFNRTPGPFFAGVLWPVVMPVVGGVCLVNKIKDRPTRVAKAVGYSEAPLSILSAMVAQRLVAYPACFNSDGHWLKDSIKLSCSRHDSDQHFYWIEVNGNTFARDTFSDKDRSVIEKAIRKAKDLNNARKAADAAAAINHKALDCIESVLLSPVKKENEL